MVIKQQLSSTELHNSPCLLCVCLCVSMGVCKADQHVAISANTVYFSFSR